MTRSRDIRKPRPDPPPAPVDFVWWAQRYVFRCDDQACAIADARNVRARRLELLATGRLALSTVFRADLKTRIENLATIGREKRKALHIYRQSLINSAILRESGRATGA